MSKASKIVLGVVAGVVALGAAGGAAYFFFLRPKSSSGSSSSGDPGNIEKLSAPANLSFDSTNYVLSWDSVSHADGYKVDINGVISTSQTNSFHYVPSNKTTKFKVQAVDSTNTYTLSNWSTEISYIIPSNQVTLASLFSFASGTLNDNYRVVKFVSLYQKNNDLYTVAEFDNNRVYLLKNRYDDGVTSLKNIINNQNHGNSHAIIDSCESKEYNSISYYLQSDVYEGTLQDYRDQGYEFNVIASQSYKASRTGMGVYTLFKLNKNDDTKYVHSHLYFVVEDTQNEAVKYTTALVNLASNYIREIDCVELSGDFIDYAKVIENAT